MKIALVHDYLFEYAGSERVVEQILRVFPQADLFALFDFIPPGSRGFLLDKPCRTSFLQRLPVLRRDPPRYLPYVVPLMPFAVEQFDLSSYDLVISSSHSVAKGALSGPDALHVAYVHSPMRYAWDQSAVYTRSKGFPRGPAGAAARAALTWMRLWDYRTANGVDQFVANSRFIARRIEKLYRRESAVIYPPVEIESFPLQPEKGDYYLAVSRFVPYKRLDLLVEAFRAMPGRQLILIGSGPEEKELRRRASENVRFLRSQSQADLARWMGGARALVQAAQEDFGIASVEAQSTGTPVIAYRRGGAGEIIRGLEDRDPTGILYAEQSPEAILAAVEKLEMNPGMVNPASCRENAARFGAARFRQEFSEFVGAAWSQFQGTDINLRLSFPIDIPHGRS